MDVRGTRQTMAALAVLVIILTSALAWQGLTGGEDGPTGWTRDFGLEDRNLSSTGRNDYFILEVGYQLVLEGKEDGKDSRLAITVLNETEMVGPVETRVVEEREWLGGKLVEVSRNYFAIDVETGSVFYFGEAVDDYEGGQVVGHGGQWRADEDGNRAGLMMPAEPLVGARYYQEVAPDVAMDRAVVVSTTAKLTTPAGSFTGCLKTEETTPIEPDALEYKMYAPGVGLIRDAELTLVSYGFLED